MFYFFIVEFCTFPIGTIVSSLHSYPSDGFQMKLVRQKLDMTRGWDWLHKLVISSVRLLVLVVFRLKYGPPYTLFVRFFCIFSHGDTYFADITEECYYSCLWSLVTKVFSYCLTENQFVSWPWFVNRVNSNWRCSTNW